MQMYLKGLKKAPNSTKLTKLKPTENIALVELWAVRRENCNLVKLVIAEKELFVF